MKKTTKPTALVTALALCSVISSPALAEQTDTLQLNDALITGQISETAAPETASDTDAQETVDENKAEMEDSAEEAVHITEADENAPDEQSFASEAEDHVTENEDTSDAAESGLLADDAEYFADSWYEINGRVLTLKGQLPDTSIDASLLKRIGKNELYFTKIVIEPGTKAGNSAAYMFWDFKNVTEIEGLSNLDTSRVVDMKQMFSACDSMTSIDLSGWDTSSVKNMSSMFYYNPSLTSVNLSGLNTSNVTNMYGMFGDCRKIESVDLSGIDTSNVTNMGGMFKFCSNLKSLDLSGFKTSKVYGMKEMFLLCCELQSLDLSGFDTSNVCNMSYMFSGCGSLESLDLSSFDTRRVIDMERMFSYDNKLASVFVSDKWNTNNVVRSDDMFYECTELIGGAGTRFINYHNTDKSYAHIDGGIDNPGYFFSIDVFNDDWYSWDDLTYTLTLKGKLPNTFNIPGTFKGYNLAYYAGIDRDKIKKIIVTNGTTAGTNACFMFGGMTELTQISGLNNLDTSKVTDMSYMFVSTGVNSLDLSHFDTSNVTDMNFMFSQCENLSSLDLSSFDTSKVVSMSRMFNECHNLNLADLSSFDISKVRSMEGMFFNCNSLRTIIVSDRWNTRDINFTGNMFKHCEALIGGKGTTYNMNKTDKEYAHIDGGTSNPGYLTSAAPKATVKCVFGGRVVAFDYFDSNAKIYYKTGSSNINMLSKSVKPGESVVFDKEMKGSDAALYYKAYSNGKWSPVCKIGINNVKLSAPVIIQSGPKSKNNFKIYSTTPNSYIVYTLDGSNPEIVTGSNKLIKKNGTIIWKTSDVINVPKGKTVKAIVVRCGYVNSDVNSYRNK